MNLSSIAFSSLQNAMASAYAQSGSPAGGQTSSLTVVSARSSSATAAAGAPSNVIPIRASTGGYPGASTVLAKDLSSLLQGLASGDVASSQSALETFSLHVGAHDNGDGSGSGLSTLLSRVSTRLSSGNTEGALSDVQSFLLSAGQVRGTGFSATV